MGPDSHIVGTVSLKISKPGPKHATELHRSINFNIDFVCVSESPILSAAQAVQVTKVSSALVGGTVLTQAKFTEIGGLHREVVKGLRMRVEEIELAPWQPLLTKVEKFNRLMAGILDVSLVKH